MLHDMGTGRIGSGMWRPLRVLLPAAILLLCMAVAGALWFVSPASATTAFQMSSRLLITEVYYDTPGADEDEEWIELANLGNAEIALGPYGLGDEEEEGGSEGMLRFPADASLRPGQVIVVAQTASGFRRLFGQQPDYEIKDSDPAVPDMVKDDIWATGSLGLNNSGDEVLLVDGDNLLVDAVSYGDSGYFFTTPVASVPRGHSIERAPAHCDSDSAADWKPALTPTPGQVMPDGACTSAADLLVNGQAPAIGVIQGPGDRSPLVNEVVTFRGIVTGVQEDRNARGVIFYTMFVQDGPEAADGNPDTSDAIPVFLARNRPPARPGDEVLVRGRVTEFYGLTEIDYQGLNVQILSRDNALPEPVSLSGTVQSEALEALEGMLVSLPPAPVVGPTFSGCGFAVAPDRETTSRPIREAYDESAGSVVPVLYWSDVDCRGFPLVKFGDVIEGLRGPLTYHFDEFKIVLQSAQELAVHAEPLPELPPAPALASGEFSVATFNLNDYFDPIDHIGTDAEPKPTLEELRRKQTKLTNVIGDVLDCPTLLGVQEAEHEALLLELADMLQERCDFLYEVSHLESADARGIDVALLSRPERVQVQAMALRQACLELPVQLPVEPAQVEAACAQGAPPLFSRPPLVIDLLLDGRAYNVYVNHFKSKREGEAETAPQREAQAAFLRALVDRQLAHDARARLIVMGDFNDYPLSAPLQTLLHGQEPGGSFTLYNAMQEVPREQRYTYIFSGVSQLLDTILLSPALAERVTAATIVHVNADYPVGLAADGELSFHASDHDVPLLVIQGADVPPTPTPLPATPSPTAQPSVTPALATPTSAPTAEPQPSTAVPSRTRLPATATPAPRPAPGADSGPLSTVLVLVSVAVLAVAVTYLLRR